jgi:hypothetical protein
MVDVRRLSAPALSNRDARKRLLVVSTTCPKITSGKSGKLSDDLHDNRTPCLAGEPTGRLATPESGDSY